MLTQLVRPMVRTQIRLLAGSQATRPVLVKTIAQWLGFLGVEAHVTQLNAQSNQIQLSLTVGKPEACDHHDWEKILTNLNAANDGVPAVMPAFNEKQQKQIQRLLAYVIQVGNPSQLPDWETIEPHLETLGLAPGMVMGIRSALKVPQSLDLLLENLDNDVAAVALPRAVSLALADRQVNDSEDHALSALLKAMKAPAKVG